jgi:N-acetylated-alpha-linked acidic dipeptidase
MGAELSSKAVAYFNRDAGAGGPYFSASAVHSLTPFLYEVAKAVPSNRPGTLYDRWLERQREQAPKNSAPINTPSVGALGSGSDYTALLDHLGVSSVDLGLSGDGVSGTYHSIYDDPLWFKKYIDPGFTYSVVAARVTGVAVLRFADAQVLPFDYEAYGRQIRNYVDEIDKDARSRATNGKSVDLTPLKNAADALTKAGAAMNQRAALLLAGSPDSAALAAINHRLVTAERNLLEPKGLPERPWFRHTIYAPGLETGYDVKTIPGVREAVEAGDFGRAAEQAAVAVRALQRAAETLGQD